MNSKPREATTKWNNVENDEKNSICNNNNQDNNDDKSSTDNDKNTDTSGDNDNH